VRGLITGNEPDPISISDRGLPRFLAGKLSPVKLRLLQQNLPKAELLVRRGDTHTITILGNA